MVIFLSSMGMLWGRGQAQKAPQLPEAGHFQAAPEPLQLHQALLERQAEKYRIWAVEFLHHHAV